MPLRDKLKKVFHRDHEDGEASPRASRDEARSPVSSPKRTSNVGSAGQRPVSVSAIPPLSGQGNAQAGSNSNVVPADRQPITPGKARRSEDVMTHARVPSNTQSAGYSEDVADWNLVNSSKAHDKSAVPAPLQVGKEPANRASLDPGVQQNGSAVTTKDRFVASPVSGSRTRGDSISRKAVPSSPIGVAVTSSSAIEAGKSGHHLERKPHAPDLREQASLEEPASTLAELPPRDMAASKHVKKYAVRDATEAPSLTGIVDLNNTVDTTVDERWAPAVVHENVKKHFHHIREEVITREIHNYDVYHRILPIIDIEVLPTRHFVPDGKGGLIEISESEIPGRVGPYRQNWAIVETVSTGVVNHEPRKFTARPFHGNEGDYKEYTSDKGIKTTETTWVHPPTLSEYGQTVPFYFNSPDPRDDGLRIQAPRGPVSGSSRLFAEENGLPSEKHGLSSGKHGLSSGKHGLSSGKPLHNEMGKLSLNEDVSSKSFADDVLSPPRTATGSGL